MLAEPIARPLDLDDDGVMEESVEQRRGDDRVAEDVAPFGEAAVGGEDHRTLFVAGIDQLEEQVATAGDDRQVADLVDDEQRGASQPTKAFAQASFALGLGQRSDDVGEGREVDAASGLDRLDAECHRQVAFTGAGRAEDVDDLVAVDELELGEGQDTAVARLTKLQPEIAQQALQ